MLVFLSPPPPRRMLPLSPQINVIHAGLAKYGLQKMHGYVEVHGHVGVTAKQWCKNLQARSEEIASSPGFTSRFGLSSKKVFTKEHALTVRDLLRRVLYMWRVLSFSDPPLQPLSSPPSLPFPKRRD